MNWIHLLLGIMIAMGAFAAMIWSVAQTFRVQGSFRAAHIAAALVTIGIMAAISLKAPLVARLLAIGLVLCAIVLVYLEERWSKLLPVLQGLFGFLVILTLPSTLE